MGPRRRRLSTSRPTYPRERGAGPFLRRWTVPAIGAITPILLIVVNIAAFIVKHLEQFRWTITALAFISGLLLNSWTALNIYRTARRRRPNWRLLQDSNQEVLLFVAMGVVIIASFLTALFCYLGLGQPQNLPNSLTFLTGVIAIAIPILLQAFFRREVGPGADSLLPTSEPGTSPAPSIQPPPHTS